MQFVSPQKCIEGGSRCNLAYPPKNPKTWFSVSLEQTWLILTFHAQRALVAQHGEESPARKGMVLEGNHSPRGLVAEITKTVPDAICQPKKLHLGIFRVVPGVIWLLICSKCI